MPNGDGTGPRRGSYMCGKWNGCRNGKMGRMNGRGMGRMNGRRF